MCKPSFLTCLYRGEGPVPKADQSQPCCSQQRGWTCLWPQEALVWELRMEEVMSLTTFLGKFWDAYHWVGWTYEQEIPGLCPPTHAGAGGTARCWGAGCSHLEMGNKVPDKLGIPLRALHPTSSPGAAGSRREEEEYQLGSWHPHT